MTKTHLNAFWTNTFFSFSPLLCDKYLSPFFPSIGSNNASQSNTSPPPKKVAPHNHETSVAFATYTQSRQRNATLSYVKIKIKSSHVIFASNLCEKSRIACFRLVDVAGIFFIFICTHTSRFPIAHDRFLAKDISCFSPLFLFLTYARKSVT